MFAKFEPNPEPFEEISIELPAFDSVPGMIKFGELQHALCIAAFTVTGLCFRN